MAMTIKIKMGLAIYVCWLLAMGRKNIAGDVAVKKAAGQTEQTMCQRTALIQNVFVILQTELSSREYA